MALPAKKRDDAAALLAAHPVPMGESRWASEAREQAAAWFLETGAPAARDEYWRFTNPAALIAAETPKGAAQPAEEPAIWSDMECIRIVFVDGIYRADLSDDLSGENLSIEPLSEALEAENHWARDLFGLLEGRGQSPVPRPLASLNTAVARQGMVIRATGPVSRPVAMRYLHQEDDCDAVLHHLVRVEEGARLTLLENGPAAARFNKCMEVDVARGAEFHHVRSQGREHERRAVTHIFARVGADALFKTFTMTANGRLTRNECVVEMVGDNGSAHIAGCCLGDGSFLHDDTVFITHDAENCESRQVFKKVLRNGATGVFQGKILVKPGAQGTDGYQISQGLMLDDDSQFLAKPELEIYADDVACSHGSTVGAVDPTALFYLTSRGVPKDAAQDMLVLAFVDEAVQEIADDRLADDIRARLQAWMARRRQG
ncbi:SufD family Fe-S cluster assembly protein [Paroceanicella profunda]|uniref:SufD family Fe-S cluster assembly protein n=1 Tax=Paroceanicella profunda TaxID=2579971 RepID=A0A5B8FIC9_9RHOB|nr:SufD family Fe-S cluster assembly protein [Paroceanicella profunda]QDL92948.1 SufD family Fe-S cluster assembly protein [Paroceanicella profunda]